MRTDLPEGIKTTAQDLSPDAIVSLFKMELTAPGAATVIYFTPHKEVTWLGNTYSEIPCTMAQMEQDAQGRANRPKFTFANPGGVFTGAIQQGYIDNAALTRFRILKADLDANINAKVTEKFFVSKVMVVNKDLVSVELRDVFDGHMFKLPARSYYPPEFPHVSLY
jgi:lambda family phage minor tail protein L